jgi:serine/threonine protein kinase
VDLKDLKQVAVLGAGAFGQVTLVKHEGRYYALKTLAKMHIVQTGLTVRLESCCTAPHA